MAASEMSFFLKVEGVDLSPRFVNWWRAEEFVIDSKSYPKRLVNVLPPIEPEREILDLCRSGSGSGRARHHTGGQGS